MAKKKDLDVTDNITPIEAPTFSVSEKEAAKETLRKHIEEETRIVEGRFRNIENPGIAATIIVRKYAGIPDFKKIMMDGQVYKIPLYVARHLQGYDVTAKKINGRINSCSYAVHGWKASKDQFPTSRDPSDGIDDTGMTVPILHKRRFGFESLEFENAM